MCATIRNAVITGANGFLGQALCRNLSKKGIRVFAVVRRETADVSRIAAFPGVEIIVSNFSEYRNLSEKISNCDIDVVYHMAWAGVNGESKQECSVQLTNIYASCDIVYACKEMNCSRVVFAASVSEYSIYEMMRTDGTPPAGTLYHSAKLSADFFMRTLAGKMGMKYVRALLPSVYGPYFDRKTAIFLHRSMEKLIKGEHCSFTSAEQMYDFIYVDDAAEAFALLGEKGKSNKTYYVGNPPQQLKKFLIEMGEEAAPGVELKFGELSDEGVVLDYNQFYSDAVFEDTGFRPKTGFHEGVRRTVEWLRQENLKEIQTNE